MSLDGQQALDLIDGLVYADVFNCALTEEEVWRYSRARIRRDELSRRLRDDPALRALLEHGDGLYCLRGRGELRARREPRRRLASRLRRRASLVARLLQCAPFVRGLLLTGSVAAGDAEPDADVDLLVLVAPGRLATAFVLLGGVSRMLSRKLFCPNHYLSEERMLLSRRDLYVAHELAQAEPLAGRGDELLDANGWAVGLLPNCDSRGPRARRSRARSLLRRLLELPLRGRLGDRLERRLHGLAASRLAAHYEVWGREVPAEVIASFEEGTELRFHGAPFQESVLERYAGRREELRALMPATTINNAPASATKMP